MINTLKSLELFTMSNNIVTHETYKNETNSIEKNLKENCLLANRMLKDFIKNMDEGNFADLALKEVYEKNYKNATNAWEDYKSLPISGYL